MTFVEIKNQLDFMNTYLCISCKPDRRGVENIEISSCIDSASLLSRLCFSLLSKSILLSSFLILNLNLFTKPVLIDHQNDQG